nr:hypothetical protein [Tanacetum cinerariifolium]
ILKTTVEFTVQGLDALPGTFVIGVCKPPLLTLLAQL